MIGRLRRSLRRRWTPVKVHGVRVDGRTVLDAPGGCQWVCRPDFEQCSRQPGHDGEHLSFVPGIYLPPPLLHPLDALALVRAPWWRMVCPLCHRRLSAIVSDVVQVFRGGQENWDAVLPEIQTQFEPCGCVVRELVA